MPANTSDKPVTACNDPCGDEQAPIANPCIRNCCLDDQDICIGCGRSLTEILGWNDASPAERQAILARCDIRKKSRKPFF